MRIGRYAFTLCAASALLAGCGGSQGALSPPVEVPALSQFLARGTGQVQYFSNYDSSTLLEYDYPKSESPIGSISFSGGGECTKGARTFWATGSNEIAEFEAGGAKPIRELKASASACAIDPATGDLAATLANNGDVIIFPRARGRGKVISPLGKGFFDGYDDKSNLFVDGFNAESFELAELPKGSGKFQGITTSNTVEFPGSVQWDGKYLTVLDQSTDAIYQYSVSGTYATLKGTVSLSVSADCSQTWIAQPYVYCADASNGDGEVYNYPAGGSPVATFTSPLDSPVGVVSLRAR